MKPLCKNGMPNRIFNKLNFSMLEDKDYTYDYNKYPLGYIVPGLENKVVEIVKGEKQHGFGNFKEAENWARQNIAKVYSNEETGGKGEITIGSNAIGKFLSKSAVSKSDDKDIHLSILKIIPQIICKAISVEIHPDFLKINNERKPENGYNSEVLVHRLYGAVQFDHDIYRVKITIKENIHGNFPSKPHSYEAKKIELLDGTLNNTQGSTAYLRSSSISKTNSEIKIVSSNLTINEDGLNLTSSISAAKLLKNVEMSYRKEKIFSNHGL